MLYSLNSFISSFIYSFKGYSVPGILLCTGDKQHISHAFQKLAVCSRETDIWKKNKDNYWVRTLWVTCAIHWPTESSEVLNKAWKTRMTLGATGSGNFPKHWISLFYLCLSSQWHPCCPSLQARFIPCGGVSLLQLLAIHSMLSSKKTDQLTSTASV